MKGNCIITVHQLAQKYFGCLWGEKDICLSIQTFNTVSYQQNKKLPQRKIYRITYTQFRNTAEVLAVFQVYGIHYIIQRTFHLPKRVTEVSALVSLLRFVNTLTLVVMDAQTSSQESSVQSQHSQCETNLNIAQISVVQLHGLTAQPVNQLLHFLT